MKLQSEFSREFLKTVFARLPPLASAARCGPHPRTPLATPLRKGKKWKFPHSQGIVEVWNKYSAVAAIQVVQVVRCTRAHDPWGPTSEDQIAIFLKN